MSGMELTKPGRVEIQPGEGERRAQRGYVTQYDFAASLIYEGTRFRKTAPARASLIVRLKNLTTLSSDMQTESLHTK